MGQCLIEKDMSRCYPEDIENPLIGNALIFQALNQPLAGALRGHADTSQINRVHT
jgi:hypothetical protein